MRLASGTPRASPRAHTELPITSKERQHCISTPDRRPFPNATTRRNPHAPRPASTEGGLLATPLPSIRAIHDTTNQTAPHHHEAASHRQGATRQEHPRFVTSPANSARSEERLRPSGSVLEAGTMRPKKREFNSRQIQDAPQTETDVLLSRHRNLGAPALQKKGSLPRKL